MSAASDRLAGGITRAALEDDAVRTAMRERHPEVALHTDAELLDSVRATRAAAPVDTSDGLWLFGYGSLLWNPCVTVAEQRGARLYGFHRDFRLRLTYGRGSPQAPGLMLGLVPGGSCRGIALRIGGADLEHELHLVWRRELLTGVYRPRWVRLATEHGPLDAVAFIVDPAHRCHCGRLDTATTVELMATGHGLIGSCADYLENTVAHLDAAGIHDRRLHALRARVRARRGGRPG
ncbi:MAG: gamma-glutamylcyclotransferase [Halofilum sp. (in: g-proteobacteria)]|nr:gamma-glutamylcyclotransferase [Halofilum sp. (in: g-proteobacteria)]